MVAICNNGYKAGPVLLPGFHSAMPKHLLTPVAPVGRLNAKKELLQLDA